MRSGIDPDASVSIAGHSSLALTRVQSARRWALKPPTAECGALGTCWRSRGASRAAPGRGPPEGDHTLNAVDPSLPGFALAAVGGVHLFVREIHGDALERKVFAIGINTDRHCGTRAERGHQPGRKGMGRCPCRRRFPARPRVGGDGPRRCPAQTFRGQRLPRVRPERAPLHASPGGETPKRRALLPCKPRPRRAEQVVGIIERDEALRMLCCQEHLGRVVDRHGRHVDALRAIRGNGAKQSVGWQGKTGTGVHLAKPSGPRQDQRIAVNSLSGDVLLRRQELEVIPRCRIRRGIAGRSLVNSS
jgi:hypothetical protein